MISSCIMKSALLHHHYITFFEKCRSNNLAKNKQIALSRALGRRRNEKRNKTKTESKQTPLFYGVRYGARTHDLQGHNLTR